MASINVQKFQAESRMPGLKNQKPNATGSVSVPSQNLNAGGVVKYSFTMNSQRTNALTTFRVRLTGIETNWRQVQGYIQVDEPSLAAWDYSVQVQGYYSGASFVCDIYLINQAGILITTPAFTVDGELNLFVAPF
jgi:hypothetical protein